MLKTFLVFYGYLSIYFGWIFYAVVFLSLVYAIYEYAKHRDFFTTAGSYIKAITYLGIADLIISSLVALLLTLHWSVS